MYTGRKINVDGTRTSETGLGARVVTDLTRSLVRGHYHIYMDNYFTGIPLFKELLNDGLYACGTIKSNRKGWPSAFHPKLLKNQGDYQVCELGKTNLVATCWHDKRQVNVLSTNSAPNDIVNIERRQKTREVKIVPAPVAVQNYQAYMNGIDHADQLRMQYTCARKSRKYWKYIYYNAFLLMKMSPNHVLASKIGRIKQRELLDFRRKLATQHRADGKRSVSNIDHTVRGHWQQKMKKNRCKQCLKSKIRRDISTGYEECQTNLCLECFKPWHRDVC